MSESLRHPQLEPPERLLTVIADYGPDGGGWGPASIVIGGSAQPFVYTAEATHVLAAAHRLAKAIADSGREARVVRFTRREDLGVYEP